VKAVLPLYLPLKEKMPQGLAVNAVPFFRHRAAGWSISPVL